jgi:alkylation response protein AidB-like acyl-CoA dehydrogenase
MVSGQKVWTSLGHVARWGFLLARTDIDVAKHKGLTCFVLDMQAPGVDIRPLRQMTGDAEFSEIFLDDVRVPDSSRVGDVNTGWSVAITTLMNERTSIGGAIAGHAADPMRHLVEVYRKRHVDDPVARDRVVRLWIETEVLQLTAERARQAAESGNPGAESSVLKLLGCELNQKVTDLVIDLLGPDGLVDAGDDTGLETTPASDGEVRRFLRARANTIEGGTSEIQRNVLGERVLGLSAEPRADRGQTWAETRSST